jgi:hypothetical protein
MTPVIVPDDELELETLAADLLEAFSGKKESAIASLRKFGTEAILAEMQRLSSPADEPEFVKLTPNMFAG